MQFRFPNLGKLAIAKFGVIVSTVVIACLMLGMAWAQDGAANAPAVPVAAPAPVTENMLVKTWNALGTMYAVVFLIMSIVLVALVVRAILAVQKNNFIPDDLVQGIETSLGEKNPQAAVELVRADESFLAVVVSAGLEKIQKGKDAVLEAMQIAGDSETMRVEHLLSYIALIGNIAPMVGLLGTVQGMVASFGTIASSAQTPKPNELASGIEQALYTTLVGLYLAIPAIAIYNILRNTVQRRIMTAGTKSEEIMEQFQALSK